MKKYAVMMVVVLVVLFASTVKGEVVTSKLYNQYIVGSGAVLYPHAVQQTDVYKELTKNWYADIWACMSYDGWYREVNYTVGRRINARGLNLDGGLTYIDYTTIWATNGDMAQPYLTVSKDIIRDKDIITPYIKIEIPFPVRSSSPRGGVYLYGGVKHGIEFSKLYFFQEMSVAYDGGAYEADKGFIGSGGITTGYKATKNVAIEWGSKIYVPLNNLSDRKAEAITNIGFSAAF